MSEIVNVKEVAEGFVEVSFDGSAVRLVLNEERGFFNASELCSQVDVKFGEYNSRGRNKTLERWLKKNLRESRFEVTKRRHPGVSVVVGTYLHPALLLDLALWISPRVYAHAAIIIAEIAGQKDLPPAQSSALFGCGESATCEALPDDPPLWRFRYSDFELTVDERGCLDAQKFCSALEASLEEFEGDADVEPLLAFLGDVELIRESPYYSPLLFLRLVADVAPDLYVKCAHLVFCGDDDRVRPLFRKEILAAGPGYLSPGKPDPEPKRSPSTDRPASRTDPRNWRPADRPLSDDSDESIDSSDESDSSPRRRRGLRDRERLSWIEKIQRERAVKEEALARVKEKDATLERVMAENRRKDKDLERLQRELEDLQIRTHVKRKPPNSDCDVDDEPSLVSILRDTRSVGKVECLVLFELTSGSVYACRRQLNSALWGIRERLDCLAAFVGWFLTTNAVTLFHSVKEEVTRNAEEGGRRVTCWRNQLTLTQDGQGDEFSLPNACLTALRKEPNVIEADVRVFGKTFKKPALIDDYVAPTDREIVEFLDSVYKWVKKRCKK